MSWVEELMYITSGEASRELYWSTAYGRVRLHVNVNDAFAWGVSDTQEITINDLSALRQARSDLAAAGDEEGVYLFTLHAARQRGMRPQGAWYDLVPHQIARLFDACGPERATSLANPVPAAQATYA